MPIWHTALLVPITLYPVQDFSDKMFSPTHLTAICASWHSVLFCSFYHKIFAMCQFIAEILFISLLVKCFYKTEHRSFQTEVPGRRPLS
jgi:hypothetical protein